MCDNAGPDFVPCLPITLRPDLGHVVPDVTGSYGVFAEVRPAIPLGNP
nr:hypothetical protein OG461_26610 [Streptomyces sp. NBC_00995]